MNTSGLRRDDGLGNPFRAQATHQAYRSLDLSQGSVGPTTTYFNFIHQVSYSLVLLFFLKIPRDCRARVT